MCSSTLDKVLEYYSAKKGNFATFSLTGVLLQIVVFCEWFCLQHRNEKQRVRIRSISMHVYTKHAINRTLCKYLPFSQKCRTSY